MRVVKFLIDIRVNDDDQYPVTVESILPYSFQNLEYARSVAIDSNVTIDEIPDIVEKPTEIEKLRTENAVMQEKINELSNKTHVYDNVIIELT